MKEVRIIPFVLLFIGTLGLLLNEFVLSWNHYVTITFALFNVLGLISLVILNKRKN
ncbi:MAG: hypothetical protein JW996_04900 [Candidatus Cloacimonetes bacterium]|nr:hypothetical protein [Candidatus Cloacimonadota bacterium]